MKPFKLPTIETYFGGKGASGTYQKIINEIRPHDIRIIPFLGNCAITRHMATADTIVGIDKDPQITEAWKGSAIADNMILLNECGIKFLERLPQLILEHNKYVIYADPPYPLASRKQQRKEYNFEMSDNDHERLLSALLNLSTFPNVDILLSTYPNDIYRTQLLEGEDAWNHKEFQSMTRRGPATEWLIWNYSNEEGLLHDYSYLGEDYRERERIKIKIQRFQRKMQALPATHRQAIINSLNK